MVEHGFPRDGGPIAVMLHEHERGRGARRRARGEGRRRTAPWTRRRPAGDRRRRERRTRACSTRTSTRRTRSSTRWRSSTSRPRRWSASPRTASGSSEPQTGAGEHERYHALADELVSRHAATSHPAGERCRAPPRLLRLAAPEALHPPPTRRTRTATAPRLDAVCPHTSQSGDSMSHKGRAILLFTIVACFTRPHLRGREDLRAQAADPRARRRAVRRGRVDRRGHPPGPAPVPLPRRTADRLDLGPRRLPRAGLVRRRAPPRSASSRRGSRAASRRRRPPRSRRRSSRRSPPASAAGWRRRSPRELRQNRYDAATDTLTLSPGQAAALPALVAYYTRLFGEGSDAMSIPARLRRRTRPTPAR